MRRSTPSKVCSHVDRGRCCMSSGPFVGCSGGHCARSSRCDGKPSLRSWRPSSVTGSRSYHLPTPRAPSPSTPPCASRPAPTRGSPPPYRRMLKAMWYANAGMFAASPAVDLDHVGGVGVPEQQRALQTVVRLRPGMVARVEPLLRLNVERARVHAMRADVAPHRLGDAVLGRPRRVAGVGARDHARVLLDAVERLPVMAGPGFLVAGPAFGLENGHGGGSFRPGPAQA